MNIWRRTLHSGGLLILVALLAVPSGGTPDWVQWRGPNRDGHVPGFQAPATWPARLNRGWKVEVGEGYSSPLISDGAAFIFSRQAGKEVIRRLDLRTGKEIWATSYPVTYELASFAKDAGIGPKATPAVAAGRIYTLGISGMLSCLEVQSGHVLWRKNFAGRYKRSFMTAIGM